MDNDDTMINMMDLEEELNVPLRKKFYKKTCKWLKTNLSYITDKYFFCGLWFYKILIQILLMILEMVMPKLDDYLKLNTNTKYNHWQLFTYIFVIKRYKKHNLHSFFFYSQILISNLLLLLILFFIFYFFKAHGYCSR